MNYRVATRGDAGAIARLHAQSWVDTYRGMMSDEYLDKDVWTERQSSWAERFANPAPNQYVLVAVEENPSNEAILAGFICVFGNHHAKRGTFVDNLHVSSGHQGRGIGKVLMLKAAEWSLQTYPDNGMYLEVLEENHGARRFYKRLGATHQETNLWQPPGGDKVKDMLFAWEKIEDFMSHTQSAEDALRSLGVELREFVPASATDAEWNAFFTVSNRENSENNPEDPPTTLDELKKGILNIPQFVQVKLWLGYRGAAPIATMVTVIMLTEENQHLMQFDIYLVPEERRQQIGSYFLHWVVAQANEHNRRLLITDTSSMIPSGDAFIGHLGGEMALAGDENQLLVEELDHQLMDQWLSRAEERSGDLQMGIWKGLYPEEEIEAIAEMKQIMNTAPRDDLDMEDFNITPEIIRQTEESFAARDTQRWTYYVRDPENNALAGYTELYWRPSKPEYLGQGDTAVVPAYRNRGIGRWVKAAAIKGVLTELPNVKYVRTGNASSNAGMLKINHEMGFKLHKTSKNWQIPLSNIEAYIAQRKEAV